MTSKDSLIEIITVWDGTWVDKLNESVTPLLKDIYFEHHVEKFNIDGRSYDGQDLVKIVIDTDSGDYFLNTLREGDLNRQQLYARLEGFIWREFKFDLYRHLPDKSIL